MTTPVDFFTRLCDKYDQAVESGEIVFTGDASEAEVESIESGSSSVKVLYRLLASLLHRPEQGSVDTDPFAKSEPSLTVLEEYGEGLKVVFNRYPVVPRHFLLVTREFVSQNSPLSGNELLATYKLLYELKEKDFKNRWFAFYNCGQQSGALQPHKHIQFISQDPRFESYAEALANTSDLFIPTSQREPLQNKDMPFAHFVARLGDNALEITEDSLVMCFASLLQRCLTVLRDNDASHILYNAIITTKFMMLVPRSSNKYKDLGINSCGMLGLYMMKNEALLDIVKKDGPLTIMAKCGFPSTAGQLTNEYHY